MKKLFTLFAIIAFSFSSINAQYEVGKNYVGPSIGIAWIGSALNLGANFEHGMQIEGIPGLIGIGGVFRYSSYGDDIYTGSLDYTVISIGAQGNYHFKLENSKLDPYVGLALGYQNRSWDEPDWWDDRFFGDPDSGGLFFGAHVGIRYFFSPQLSVNARVGEGNLFYGGLDVGVDFKF